MLKTINPWQLLILCVGIISSSCTYEVLPAENACTAVPQLTLVSTQQTDCGDATGEIVVEATDINGTALKFSLDGKSENVTGRFENLAASTYLVAVETIDGCSSTLSVVVANKSGLNISVQATETDCGTDNGKFTITPDGGLPPYRYKLNEGSFQDENTFEGLASGTYSVLAEDASGCNVLQSIVITANVSFSAIQAIVQTNCVSSNCHGGNVSPDFRQANNIGSSAGRIKSRTQSKTMPPSSSGKSLTAQEIELIACWVDGGANQ